MLSNTAAFAQNELDILVKSATDPQNRPIIEPFIKEIVIIVDKFGKSGQSGGSAPYTATALSQAIKKLCLHEAICPITGIDEEWIDVSEMNGGETMYQNGRCYGLIKSADGKVSFVDAIIWKDQFGRTFTGRVFAEKGSATQIHSSQYVKSFPFTPKTFYVDVISYETKPEWWEHYVKYPNQLVKVFTYYNQKPIE